jgi:uncharacterized protein (TIGR00304 family)
MWRVLYSRLSIPISLFLAGATAVAIAVATGEAEVSLVLIFPVFSGSSVLFLLGVGLIVLGLLSAFAMMILGQGEPAPSSVVPAGKARARDGQEKSVRLGGVVLVGPIPIAYGSDRRMALAMMALAIIIMAVILLLVLW